MHRCLLHNGEIRSTSEPLLAPGQVGFLNGWGVFSTLRVAAGTLFAYDRHYRRMQRDAERLHVPFPFAPDELKRMLLKLVEANGAYEATLRVAAVRNRGGLFEAPDLRRDTDLIAFTTDLNQWGDGVRLGYRPNARFGASPFAGTKYTSWAENLTLYELAHQAGIDEFLLLNEAGEVSECTSANIFIVRSNQIWTPPLSTSGCLPGVTRGLLLEEIHIPGLQIMEHEVSISHLESSAGAFVTSSTRDLLPVLSVDGEELSQSPEVVAEIGAEFRKLRARYIEKEQQKEKTHVL